MATDCKIISILKNNFVLLIIFVTALVIGATIVLEQTMQIPVWLFLGLWAIFLIAGLVLLQTTAKIELTFLVVFLLFTIAALFLIPPFSTPDFSTQFLRAFEISQGGFVTALVDSDGHTLLPAGLIPSDLSSYGDVSIGPNWQIIDALFSTQIDYSNLQAYKFTSQAVYSPITFLPSAVGIKIASCFTANLGVIIYAARIASLGTAATLLYWAIRTMPFLRDKTLFSLFALLPLFLETCPSASGDALVYGLISLLFAYVSKLRVEKKSVNYVALALMILLLALIKIVYLPICALALLIPKESFRSKKNKYLALGVIFLCAVVANLVWLKIASQFLYFREGVNPDQQVNFILMHMARFAFILLNTITEQSGNWVIQLFGGGLNSYGIKPDLCLSLSLILVFAGTVTKYFDPRRSSWSRKERILLCGICCIVFLLTLLSLYLQWTPVGSPMIDGFQGRYLAPILPLLFSSLCCTKMQIGNIGWAMWFSVVALIFIYPLAHVF